MKIKVVSVLTFGLWLIIPSQVLAVQEMKQEAVQTRLENHCEEIQNRLQQRVGNYTIRKDNHFGIYQKLHDRLVVVAEKLKTQGLDTTQFQADLAILQTMIDEGKESYDDFVVEIEETKIVDCIEAKSQYRGILAESREKLQQFRVQGRAIHTFIKGTIRLDLTQLKKQLSVPTPTPTVTPEL